MTLGRLRDPRLLATATLAGAAMLLLFLAFLWRIHDQREFRELAYRNCIAIEDLKMAQRTDAQAEYQRLDQGLRLLGVEKTPEIVAAARAIRDARLARFARKTC